MISQYVAVALAIGAMPMDGRTEPLPPGAIVQLAPDPLFKISRFLQYPEFSSDGKTIVCLSDDSCLVTIDPETGRGVRRIRGPAPFSSFVLAADGRTAVTAEYVANAPNSAALRTWDLETGKQRKLLATGKFQSLANPILTTDGRVVITHVEASKEHKAGFEGYRISDGKLLWAAEEPRKVYDGWQSTTEIALSEYLSKPTAEATLDVTTGRLRHLDKPVEVVYPDWPGVVRYVTSCYGHGTILIKDAKTGRETARIPTMYGPNCAISVSPDGARAVLSEPGVSLHVFDVARRKEITRPAGHNEAIKTVAFTQDGRSLISAGKDGFAFVWDVRSGETRRCLRYGPRERGPGPSYWKTALAAAGLRLAAPAHIARGDNFETVTVVWDFATETEIRAFAPIRLFCIALSPDGKTLVTRNVDPADNRPAGELGIWNVATGQLYPNFGGRGDTSYASDAGACAFTADGRLWLGVKPYPGQREHGAVHRAAGAIEVWDAYSGKSLQQFNHPFIAGAPTPSGGMLIGRMLVESEQRFEPPAELVVIETTTGQIRSHFGTRPGIFHGIRATLHEAAATPFAASPDGRLVAEVRPGEQPAGGGRSAERTIVLWDATTGTELHQFTSAADVTCLAFAPDGRTLASGGADGSILIWDVAAHIKRNPPLKPDEINHYWTTLASPDASEAFRAMARLADDPAAMMNIRTRLRPAQTIPAEQLAGWVRDLDSSQFATRQQAAAALRRAWPQAEAVLREAAKSTSAEVRGQATTLLADAARPTGERLADVRAVEILEWWGTTEARATLAELAKGAPAADLTRSAVAALKRLSGRN